MIDLRNALKMSSTISSYDPAGKGFRWWHVSIKGAKTVTVDSHLLLNRNGDFILTVKNTTQMYLRNDVKRTKNTTVGRWVLRDAQVSLSSSGDRIDDRGADQKQKKIRSKSNMTYTLESLRLAQLD